MFYIVIFLLSFLVAVNITGPIVDVDLWWHIVIGRWILNHNIPTQDYWNAYSSGIFRAYSWFPEIIFAAIEKKFGITGLLTFKLFLISLILFSLIYVFRKITKDWFFAIFIAYLTSFSFVHHDTLRPQLVSWFCLIWAMYFAHNIYKNGWSIKTYIGVFLTFCLLANSHLTQALVLFCFVFWGFNGFNKNTYKLVLVPILGTLFTPYFGGEWLTFFHKFYHPVSFKNIIEFQAATIDNYCTAAFIIFMFLLCFVSIYYKDALSFLRKSLIIIMSLGGLYVIKFLPEAVVIIAFALAEVVSIDNIKALTNLNEGMNKLKNILSYFCGAGGAVFLIALIVINLNSLYKKEVDSEFIPQKAMDFIINNKLEFPLLNVFRNGGYVMYRLSNEKGEIEHKVVVDGRTNVNSRKIMKLNEEAMKGGRSWYKYVRYVKPETILWPNSSPFVNLMEGKKERWCKVYDDYRKKGYEGYSVFIKRQGHESLCMN